MKIEKTERGNIYFKIYEVKAMELNGEITTVKFYSDKELAENYLEFANRVYDEIYKKTWITSHLVWMN